MPAAAQARSDTTNSPAAIAKKVQEFKGIGPKAVEIFVRELKGVWT